MVDAQARASGGSRPLQAGTPGQRDVRVLAALASLVVLVALAGFLWYERTQELEAASSLSARRAASLAGSLRETLDLAQAATDRIESTLGPHADAASVRDTLRQTVQEIGPLLGRITLPFTIKAIDREGRILQPSPDGGTDASDRLPLPQGSGWRVESARGAPGERVLPLLRGAADPSRGVAAFVAQLDHAALLRRFDASRVPDGGSAALFRVEADGSTTLLAHAPHREAELGQRERGPLAAALARAPKGVFDALTQFDQTRRIVGYQRLGGDAPDLVVAYGMSTDAVLAGWRGLWLWAAGVALLLVGAIAAGGRRLERSLRAQARDRQALQRSESHFRALAGNLPDVVVRMDPQGRHLYANDAVQRATGLAPQEFIGKTNAELGMPARNVALWTATLGRVFDRGTTERLEFTYPGPQGVRHWESLVALEPAAPGEPATAVVISRDITERRQAEAAREALNRRVVDLLETMSDGFVSLDRQWRYQAVNRKAGQMLGRDAASLIGKHIWTEFPEGVGQPFHRAYERAMNEGTTIRMEEYYPPWDAWFENRIHPTADGISIFFTDITERRRAADALQRSEQRLREAQRMARLGHWELDLTTGALVWSDEIFRIFEIDPQRFGASYAAFLATVHPDDRDGVDLAYRRSVQEHQPYAIGHRLLLADGRIKHVQERGDSSYADDGTPLRSVGTVQDITDRVLAEQALRASEASHREMFESNPHPMWVYELETLGFLAVNDAAIRQYGYTRDEFLGMTIKDIRPREDVPRLLDKVARVGQGGLDEAGVWRHQTRDGRLLEVEITSHTLQFDGRPAELVLAHDVTRRIQVERTLRDSEERLRLAMQAANQGLYDLDLRTGDTVVSPEYARMLGYEPDEFHETNAAWRERLHPDDRDTVYRAYEDYVAGRIPDYRVEFRQRTRDGQWKWILSLGQVKERDAQGQPLRMLGTHTDITAIKQTQAALAASQARLTHLLGSAPTVIYTARAEGDYGATYYSPNLRSLLGWLPEQFTADSGFWLDHIHPDDRDVVLTQMADLPRRGEIEIEYRFSDAQGRWRWMRDAVRMVHGADGRPAELVGSWVDITERRAAAERFEKLFLAAPEAISLSALDSGRFLQVNDAFCQLFGHAREAVIGRTSAELEMWTQPQGRAEIVARLQAGETIQGFEGRARHSSGAEIDVLFSAERVEFGGADCLLLMFRDVTERKRAEQALRRSEQRFRLAAAFGQVWEWDFAAGGVVPSTELFTLLGHAAPGPAQMAQAFEALLHPDDYRQLRQTLRRHLKRAGPYHVQFRARDAHGRWHWFESQGQALWDAQGRATYMAGTTFEITERREAEDQVRRLAAELEQRVQERTAQLAQSEARYRSIFDTVPISIGEEDWSGVQQLLRELRDSGVTDAPGYFATRPDFVQQCLRAVKVQRLNRKALALHDARDKQTDLPDLQAVYPSPEDLPQFVGELEAMWAGQRLLTAKRSLPSVTGRPLSLMMTMSLPGLDDADGTALVCLVDITEIDRLNAELDRSLGRLRQVNRELETFTYSVSHDLKAPLRGIDGYSRLLLSDHHEQLDDEGREFLHHIRQATHQMGALIDDLLTYSRLERRDLTLARQPLAALVHGVLEGLRQDFAAAGVELTVDVDAGLHARADAQGLTMALRNLVDNAVKFSRTSRPPRITIAAERSKGRVQLSVRDNGVGFDMKFHDRIFSIFQRLHRAEDYPGTGIGLAIVRKAMERMGGRVWARSQPGQGATFTLELPEAPAP